MAIQAHFLSVALLAGGALSMLIALSTWVFRPEPRRAIMRRSPTPRDYGLLTPVARVRSAEHAQALRELLADHGIRATVAPDSGGTIVLVFATDLAQASDHVRAAGV